MKNEKLTKQDGGLPSRPLICSACRCQSEISSVVFEDGYFWHAPCYDRNNFPRNGKIIPETIMTQEIDNHSRIVLRRG